MKKVIYGVLAFAALTFTACGGADSTEEVAEDITEEVVVATYTIDPDNSKLEWFGSWTGGQNDGNKHNGIIKIADGTMFQDGDKFHGHFAIDMASIEVLDIDEASGKPKLEGHLASEDFFNVAQYAATDVKFIEYNEGNAKIAILVAGSILERTVPVTLEVKGDVLKLEGNFSVDFTEVGMVGMTVKPEKPEEGAVSTEIDFKLHIELKKKI